MSSETTELDVAAPADRRPQQRLSSKVGVIFYGMIGGFLVTLLWGMVLVRLIDREGVGTYRQVWLVYGMAAVIFQLGVPASVSYFIPQLSPRRGAGFALQVFSVMTALGGLMSAFLFLGADLLAAKLGNPQLSSLFRVFALYPLFFLPVSTMSALFIVHNRHRAAALLNLGTTAQAPLVAGTLLALGASLRGVFHALVYTAALIFSIGLIWLLRFCRKTGVEWQSDLLLRQFAYSAPIGLAATVDILGRRLDQLVISLFFPPERFAIYTVGAFEVPLFTLLASAMSSVLMPEFVRWYTAGDVERLVTTWHRAVMKMGTLILPTVVAAIMAAPIVVPLLYTKSYTESIILFQIYLLILIVRVTQYSMLLQVTGQTKLIFWASLGFLVCNLVLAVVFVKTIGFIGPAIATVVAYFFYVWLLLRQLGKALHMSLRTIMPWWQLARAAVVALAAGLPAALVMLIRLAAIPKLIFFCLVYGAAYLLIATLFRVLTREDLHLVRDWATLRPVFK